MDEDYSKREIDIMFKEIKETLSRIESQTTKTNGSVISLRLWRSWMAGGMGIIVLFVIPLLAYLFIVETKSVQAQQDIQNQEISNILAKIK